MAEGRVTYVAADEQATAALRLDQLLRLAGIPVLVQIDDGHVGPFAGKEDSHGAADAAIAAGDEGDLVLQLAAAAVLRGLILRLRRHLRFAAGLDFLGLGGNIFGGGLFITHGPEDKGAT